ncbi:hypothetical protein EVAR_28994_1 [Eumeta japonica]|uniref:Uncharacterized protein n=1 Tax=Eumeta variegata TaxID=151549 RepID=A0A4C1W126_EUMVA|nr:hypothetical protein EVAR_28994_1 [Eumeta japonica]
MAFPDPLHVLSREQPLALADVLDDPWELSPGGKTEPLSFKCWTILFLMRRKGKLAPIDKVRVRRRWRKTVDEPPTRDTRGRCGEPPWPAEAGHANFN